MSATSDQSETEAIADAFDEAFEQWANAPEIRRIIAQSVRGKVKRRSLMAMAHAIGARHGSQAATLCCRLELAAALGVDGETSLEDLLAMVRDFRRCALDPACPDCENYVGKCPTCGRARPEIAPPDKAEEMQP